MRESSRRVGPTYDTLRIVIQPWPNRTAFTVTRLHFGGNRRDDTRIASGALPISRDALSTITALGLLDLVREELRDRAKPPAPPQGDMGVQPTLDLDFSA